MNQSFTEFASSGVKRLISSPIISSLVQSTTSFIGQNKTQVVVTVSLLTALAFMNRNNEPKEQEPHELKEHLESGSEDLPIPTDLGQKQDETTQKVINMKPNVTDDLKKSWRHLNRKINRSIKLKGINGQYKLDQTFDETSEDGHVRSPDYSIVSDLDQKFYADHFQANSKLKKKKNYQTDYDSDNCLTFLKQKKMHMLKLSQDQKQGTDKLFFKLYAQVADQEIKEDDDD